MTSSSFDAADNLDLMAVPEHGESHSHGFYWAFISDNHGLILSALTGQAPSRKLPPVIQFLPDSSESILCTSFREQSYFKDSGFKLSVIYLPQN